MKLWLLLACLAAVGGAIGVGRLSQDNARLRREFNEARFAAVTAGEAAHAAELRQRMLQEQRDKAERAVSQILGGEVDEVRRQEREEFMAGVVCGSIAFVRVAEARSKAGADPRSGGITHEALLAEALRVRAEKFPQLPVLAHGAPGVSTLAPTEAHDGKAGGK